MANREEILLCIDEVIVCDKEVTEELILDEIDINWEDRFSIMEDLEARYDVRISTDDMDEWKSVKDIIDCLLKYLKD